MENKRKTGTLYEEMAARVMAEQGYELLEMNFRCRRGEIDIIARKDGYLVFAEVKYRKDARMGIPEFSVDFRKQNKIRQTAIYYMMTKYRNTEIPCRFDVVAILGEKVEIYENAFM